MSQERICNKCQQPRAHGVFAAQDMLTIIGGLQP